MTVPNASHEPSDDAHQAAAEPVPEYLGESWSWAILLTLAEFAPSVAAGFAIFGQHDRGFSGALAVLMAYLTGTAVYWRTNELDEAGTLAKREPYRDWRRARAVGVAITFAVAFTPVGDWLATPWRSLSLLDGVVWGVGFAAVTAVGWLFHPGDQVLSRYGTAWGLTGDVLAGPMWLVRALTAHGVLPLLLGLATGSQALLAIAFLIAATESLLVGRTTAMVEGTYGRRRRVFPWIPQLPLSQKRRHELSWMTNHCGEQATRLYLDGRYDVALAAANRAIEACEELYQRRKKEPEVADVLASHLRDRAEIQAAWVRASLRGTDQADGLIRGGISDAFRAQSLFFETPTARFPLRPAEIRLTLAELHAMAGEHELAAQLAGAAIVDYQWRHNVGDSEADLRLARALDRYAGVMEAAEALDVAVAARRESVGLTRPHAGPGGWLWETRFDSSLIWFSTPTMYRYCETAVLLARRFDPADVSSAAEALLALQDAAEGYASLIQRGHAARAGAFPYASETLRDMAERLRALGQPSLADRYLKAQEQLGALTDQGWHDVVSRLRPSLEKAAAGWTVDGPATGRNA